MINPLNGMLASPEATSSAKEAHLSVLPCLPMLAHLSILPSVRPHCGRSHGRAWHGCPLPPCHGPKPRAHPRCTPIPRGTPCAPAARRGVAAERHRCHQMVTPDRFPAKPITRGRNGSPLVHQVTPPARCHRRELRVLGDSPQPSPSTRAAAAGCSVTNQELLSYLRL